MFLKCEPNPHQGGRMTRAVLFDHGAGQRFAIDAEALHKQPDLLNEFGAHNGLRFKTLDAVAYGLCFVGGVGTVTVAWWMFFIGLAACVLMLAANRKSAGEAARNAARRSVDDFRRLHELGCLWLVYP
ncbi:MAG TPA: hypothetical protein PK417_10165 [Hyphomonas sp.]|nr:hypothetical protein [Hyphomonas sp.]HRX74556.1 hypothetical protein [Hyphomonas sp.]